jgi:hypothetical protein
MSTKNTIPILYSNHNAKNICLKNIFSKDKYKLSIFGITILFVFITEVFKLSLINTKNLETSSFYWSGLDKTNNNLKSLD